MFVRPLTCLCLCKRVSFKELDGNEFQVVVWVMLLNMSSLVLCCEKHDYLNKLRSLQKYHEVYLLITSLRGR